MEVNMKPSTFEEAMERLDAITMRMEQENLPLEEMMALYKEGLALQKYCVKVLDTTEKEITILQQDEEEPSW
jgi:exonuclease VII small subunit